MNPLGFSEIPKSEIPLKETVNKFFEGKSNFDPSTLDRPIAKEMPTSGEAKMENSSMSVNDSAEKKALLPKNGGEWSGEVGNSEWTPDDNVIPGDRNGTNPEHKNWSDIKDQYDFESIPFKEGEADFSEISKGTVEIDDFSEARDSNFAQADEKLAAYRGCEPEDVANWRAENKYTWHECNDCQTMMKVPSEVHGNISHSGGISVYKAAQAQD